MAENMSSQKTEGKLKKLLSGKKGRRWIVLCVLAVAVIGEGTAFLSRTRAKAAKAETTYTTASVEKRSITNALTGSGTLQPADSYTVTTLVSGEVLSDTFEEGGIVEKDQLLYTIDSSDVSTTETQAQTSYSQAQGQVPLGGHQRHRQRGVCQQRRCCFRRYGAVSDQRQQ